MIGHTATLGVARNPDSLDVLDESLIPSEYKNITVKLPAEVWSELLEPFSEDDGDRVGEVSKILQAANERACVTVDKAAIKAAIQRGETVDGADINIGRLRCKLS